VTGKIRTGSVADSGIIADLHAKCFAQGWDERAIRGLLENVNVFALLADNASQSQSFILVQAVRDQSEILSFGTEPEARRAGHARALLRAAAEEAARRGAREMYLEVAADNEAALALYESHGFVRCGARPRYYERRDAPAVDAVMLRAVLPL
jgi:[ribosomal protein S18]-alanine N-acetyltransferase